VTSPSNITEGDVTLLEGYAILEKVLPLNCPDIAYITEGKGDVKRFCLCIAHTSPKAMLKGGNAKLCFAFKAKL